MSDIPFEYLLDQSKTIARNAGKAILRISKEHADTVLKTDGSPVTRADMASHNEIISGLKSLKPEYYIVSEEDGKNHAEMNGRTPSVYWLIDPLDGTKEFLKENGEYTVNIALVKQGKPVLGVIYAPELDSMYFAAQGYGAWKRIGTSTAVQLKGQGSTNPVTAVVSRSHPSPETDFYLSRFAIKNRIETRKFDQIVCCGRR